MERVPLDLTGALLSPLSCRYMSQSKHTEARELMCSGALLFFSHGQVRGGPIPSLLGACGSEKDRPGRGLVEDCALLLALTAAGQASSWHRVLSEGAGGCTGSRGLSPSAALPIELCSE